MDFGFYAMIFRMKYIERWGIMHTMVDEKLSTHSLEVAIVAHALCVIGNKIYGKSYDADRIAVKSMFHDVPEIFTGDQPTPVKYYSKETKNAYDAVENAAITKLLAMLPMELRPDYSELMQESPEERAIIKASDKICAYLKCLEETRLGNSEFVIARDTLKKAVDDCDCEEAKYFAEHCITPFGYPIDTLLN